MALLDFLRMETPARLEASMSKQAADFVTLFSANSSPIHRTDIDYSEASLIVVDKILGDFYDRKADLPDRIHLITSAYVFEVARRAYGGHYMRRGRGENPIVLILGTLPCQVAVMVMGKIRGRAVNGPEDSIPFFYAGIALLLERGANAALF